MKLFASKIGLVGILVGAMAVTIAVFHDPILDTLSPPPPPPTLSEVAVELGAAVLQPKTAPKAAERPLVITPDDPVTSAHLALGVLALLLGLAAFLFHEDKRVVMVAVVLGILGAAWAYVMVALGIAFLLVVLFSLLEG